MHVTSINPGRVYLPIQGRDNQWAYSIEYNFHPQLTQMVSSGITYPTAAQAKHTMREEVTRLRIKHNLQEIGV